jgi:hypothetical protein
MGESAGRCALKGKGRKGCRRWAMGGVDDRFWILDFGF